MAEPIADQPAERQALAARMHNLRGSAGLLGAQNVYRLASQLETELRANAAAADAGASMAALCQALQALAVAAEPALAAHRSAESHHQSAAHAAGPVQPQDMERLATLLRQQDLAALEHFKHIAPALLNLWGATVVDPLQHAIEGFDFAAALTLLNAARNSLD
jgi:chemotaxis protein histidine kinase CheA